MQLTIVLIICENIPNEESLKLYICLFVPMSYPGISLHKISTEGIRPQGGRHPYQRPYYEG